MSSDRAKGCAAALPAAVSRARDNTETIIDELYDVVGDVAPELFKDKSFSDFVKYLVKRRMSKEGRFLRIHFKTGAWFDVVPKGSIASGSRIYIDEGGKTRYMGIRPKFDRLWEEYKSKAKGT